MMDFLSSCDFPRWREFEIEHFDQYYGIFCDLLSSFQSMKTLPMKSSKSETKKRLKDNCLSLLCAYFTQRTYVSPSNIFETMVSLLKLKASHESSTKPSLLPSFDHLDYHELAWNFIESMGILKLVCFPESDVMRYAKSSGFTVAPKNSFPREYIDLRDLWMEKLAIDDFDEALRVGTALLRNRQKILDCFFQTLRIQMLDSSDKQIITKANFINTNIHPQNHGWLAKVILRELLSFCIPSIISNEGENIQPALNYDKIAKLNRRLAIPGSCLENGIETMLLELVKHISSENIRLVLKAACTSLLKSSLNAALLKKKGSASAFNSQSFQGILTITRMLGNLELAPLSTFFKTNDQWISFGFDPFSSSFLDFQDLIVQKPPLLVILLVLEYFSNFEASKLEAWQSERLCHQLNLIFRFFLNLPVRDNAVLVLLLDKFISRFNPSLWDSNNTSILMPKVMKTFTICQDLIMVLKKFHDGFDLFWHNSQPIISGNLISKPSSGNVSVIAPFDKKPRKVSVVNLKPLGDAPNTVFSEFSKWIKWRYPILTQLRDLVRGTVIPRWSHILGTKTKSPSKYEIYLMTKITCKDIFSAVSFQGFTEKCLDVMLNVLIIENVQAMENVPKPQEFPEKNDPELIDVTLSKCIILLGEMVERKHKLKSTKVLLRISSLKLNLDEWRQSHRAIIKFKIILMLINKVL